MEKVVHFLKGETVLMVSWVLAAASMALVPPDGSYWGYVDTHTLGLLFSLMAVMAGLQGLGLFSCLGQEMLRRTATSRQLEGVLIFLPFFSSMVVTNDAALITFVPFALEVLHLAGQEERIIPVVSMQTVAANLGSMTTPVGNPQNLYLYAHYELSLGEFFATMLPFALGALVLLGLFLLLRPSWPLFLEQTGTPVPRPAGRMLLVYLLLFVLCLAGVAKLVPVGLVTALVALVILWADRGALRRVDYSLLLTFVGFFLFVGNLGRVPLFARFLEDILYQHEVICAVLVSQIISNVPAALLLSGFTQDGPALLVGVNLGGLGTLIASMASLISYKYVARSYPGRRGTYLLWFTGVNVVFLLILFVLSPYIL